MSCHHSGVNRPHPPVARLERARERYFSWLRQYRPTWAVVICLREVSQNWTTSGSVSPTSAAWAAHASRRSMSSCPISFGMLAAVSPASRDRILVLCCRSSAIRSSGRGDGAWTLNRPSSITWKVAPRARACRSNSSVVIVPPPTARRGESCFLPHAAGLLLLFVSHVSHLSHC